MIIGAAACIALWLPPAHVTMRSGMRIVDRCVFISRINGSLRGTLGFSKESHVIGDTELLRLKVRPGSDDVYVFWLNALHGGQELSIKAQLQYGAALGFSSQLCINNLVGPCPQRTRFFDPPQNIGPTNPVSIAQCSLNNNWRPCLHSFSRAGDGIIRNIDTIDQKRLKAACAKMVEEGLLMLLSAFPQDIE